MILGCFSCNQLADTFNDTFKEKGDDKKGEAPVATSSSSRVVSSSVVIESHISRDTVHTTTISSSSTNTTPKMDFLTDEAGLRNAEKRLRALPAYAGKKMYLYDDIHVYDDGRINLQLRHPDNPEYVDAYHFEKGKWSEPEPVQLSIRNKIEDKMVPLDEIDFTSITRIYKNIVEKSAAIEGAKSPTHIYGVIHEKRLSWYPRTINGSRERYDIGFNLDGSINRFSRE